MNIVFNGQSIQLPDECSLLAILSDANISNGVPIEQAVVAVNEQFVHRDDYAEYKVSSGDRIEMLTAVVGG